MIKLAVQLPAYGRKIDAGHAGMWLSLGHALASNEETFELVGFDVVEANPVADARNLCVEHALQVEADWLLMVDADTYCDDLEGCGLALLQMIRDADRQQAAVVGAPVRARQWAGHDRTVWKLDEVPAIQIPGRPAAKQTMSKAPEAYYLGKLVETPRIGGACMAVNLGWIRASMPMPPWFTHEPTLLGSREDRLRGTGEDVTFCDMVRIRGGLILVDGRVLPKHVMDGARL